MKTTIVHKIKRKTTTSLDKLFKFLLKECKTKIIRQIYMDADTQTVIMIEVLEV